MGISGLPAGQIREREGDLKACFECHKPHAAQDFVISLAGLKGTAQGEVASPKAGPGVVSVADFLFGPEKVTVAVGAPVTWFNADASPHQVTLRGAKPQRTAVMLKGQSVALSFAEAGHLRLHLRPAPQHEGQRRGEVTFVVPCEEGDLFSELGAITSP